jgi:rfaE bifunctional protein kinase chain/domain
MFQFTPSTIVSAWENAQVLVIGDVMVDEYIHGSVSRMSPEAPVPVVDVNNTTYKMGGAANVALNCKSLGAKVFIASVVGDDATGHNLRDQIEKEGIDTRLIHFSKLRPTTIKKRVLNGDKQMLRLDYEMKDDLFTIEEHPFIDAVMRFLQIHKPDMVIFEDYNKGVLKQNVIDKVLEHCALLGIATTVDPKFKNFFSYKGVEIFKPNLKEIKEALLKEVEVNLSSLNEVHNILKHKLNHHASMITLSEYGVYYNDGTKSEIIPIFKRNIVDVSGAGDTVIAVASMTFVITQRMDLAAKWSNLAGGLVCEKVGVVPIDRNQLIEEIFHYQLL